VSIYEVASKSFRDQILERSGGSETAADDKCLQTEEEMKAYFTKFAKESSSTLVESVSPTTSSAAGKSHQTQSSQAAQSNQTITASSKFMAKRIFKGYIDDPRNTGK
jgi:hypothetical protein